MKTIYRSASLLLLLLPTLVACDKDFGQFNLNPNAVTSVSPALLFSDSQVRAASWDPEQMTNYSHAFMQYGWNDFWSGTNYNLSDGISSRPWGNYYGQVLKNLEYVTAQLATQPDAINTYAAARIWRAFIYQKLTDIYGDVPYTDAAKAAITPGSTLTPAYDPQQQIYATLITELRASRDALSATAKAVQGDQFYGGDAAKWKKFANSLLLRIGMRLIKVDPAQAATLVKEAVNGGVMGSNDDMPVVKYNANLPNGFYENLGDQHFLLHDTFVQRLLATGDPRLRVFGAVYTKAKSGPDTVRSTNADLATYDYKFTSPTTILGTSPLTRVRWDIFFRQDLPYFHFPYAQVEFLLAEATIRGYITGASAADHYAKGITAHMKMLNLLVGSPTITDGQISTYLTKNPLTGTNDQQIELINTEFWVSGFLFQADEVWSNWRRTGYPRLTPSPISLTGGSDSPGRIPRKLPYPTSEFSVNSTQLTKALTVYGGTNDFNTKARVWWDVN